MADQIVRILHCPVFVYIFLLKQDEVIRHSVESVHASLCNLLAEALAC